MEILIKSINFEIDRETEEYIRKRIEGLEKYLRSLPEKKGFEIQARVSLEKITSHHQKGPLFEIQCKILLPKRDILAKAKGSDPKLVVDELKNDLKIEIERYKGEIKSLTKRRARSLKKLLHFSPFARFWRKGRIRDEGR